MASPAHLLVQFLSVYHACLASNSNATCVCQMQMSSTLLAESLQLLQRLRLSSKMQVFHRRIYTWLAAHSRLYRAWKEQIHKSVYLVTHPQIPRCEPTGIPDGRGLMVSSSAGSLHGQYYLYFSESRNVSVRITLVLCPPVAVDL